MALTSTLLAIPFFVHDSPYKYTPKSDASLRINGFLHLILEVISESNESDCCRMLLQAACLTRLGNALNKERKHPFIVSAIYIDDKLRARWYFMYQPDPRNTAVRLIM
jgi:hypothetical protein